MNKKQHTYASQFPNIIALFWAMLSVCWAASLPFNYKRRDKRKQLLTKPTQPTDQCQFLGDESSDNALPVCHRLGDGAHAPHGSAAINQRDVALDKLPPEFTRGRVVCWTCITS